MKDLKTVYYREHAQNRIVLLQQQLLKCEEDKNKKRYYLSKVNPEDNDAKLQLEKDLETLMVYIRTDVSLNCEINFSLVYV